jgi:DNA-binding Xre family transcriptional regulator
MTISSPKLPEITSKADLAVFGLGLAAGFVLYGVVFRLSTPPPTTVALVAGIAALAIKSGIQAWQDRERPSISERERQDNLRSRLIAFEELFSEGTRLYRTGRANHLILDRRVVLERRWEPNPNYEPGRTEEGEGGTYTEPPYVHTAVTEALRERVLVLHALWKTGIVTDAYAEARLDELSDFCSRKASIQGGYSEAVQKAEDSYFGARLVELMYNKNVSRAELSTRTGISMDRIRDLETSRIDAPLRTAYTLAEGLDVDPKEFLQHQSDG